MLLNGSCNSLASAQCRCKLDRSLKARASKQRRSHISTSYQSLRPVSVQASAPLDAAPSSQTSAATGAAEDLQQSSTAATSSRTSTSSSSSSSWLESTPSLLRRVLSTSSAAEAVDLIIQQLDRQNRMHALSAADGEVLLRKSLEAGNTALALSVYQQMCAAMRAQARGTPASTSIWPVANLRHTQVLVVGLCRQSQVADALATVQAVRSQGIVGSEEVSFGHVINSPMPPHKPLAVVQPQEGCKVVSDSNSRFEFELYSGTVVSCSSEALQPSSNLLLSAARAVGLWRKSPVAAVHEMVVQAPGSGSRTFRVGTATADVPAQLGDRVTVVCAPNRGSNKLKRLVLSTSPPGTQPGQALLISNHKTGIELPLLQPPVAGRSSAFPSWLLPVTVLVAGSDAASALVDPALPLLISGSLAVAASGAVASNTLLLPRLKQLPVNAVKLETIRQQLLAQHANLEGKVKVTVQEAAEDVRTLARLNQLQLKMQSVDSGSGSAYEARMSRVAAAAAGIEERLAKRLELLDGYARVMNMIEIEVEMDSQVPMVELEGIGMEMDKLLELESIKEEWQLQAAAQDEVEKLLRSPPSLPGQG